MISSPRHYHQQRTKQKDKMVVCGFSSVEGMALINVEGSGLIGIRGVDKRIFGTLEYHGVNVSLISQASSEHSCTLATSEDQAELAKKVIEEEFRRELNLNHISSVDIRGETSEICLPCIISRINILLDLHLAELSSCQYYCCCWRWNGIDHGCRRSFLFISW